MSTKDKQTMTSKRISTVLLVEHNTEDAKQFQKALAASREHPFQVTWVSTLAGAMEILTERDVAVIMLDLMLPDAQGLDVYDQIHAAAPEVIIIVLSTANDAESAQQALQKGAYDYLIKEHINEHWLPRSLRYLIDRKAVIDALLVSEERFRSMSEACPLGIFVADAEDNWVYSNPAYQDISGQTLDQIKSTSWSAALHPDDRELVLSSWRDARRKNEDKFQAETRLLRDDGKPVWIRLNSAPMHHGKLSLGYIQMMEDITQQKQIELGLLTAEEALFNEKERAQVTLDSIGDAVLTTDLQCNVTYLNRVAERMTGWRSAEALGKPIEEVLKLIDSKTHEPVVNPALHAIKANKTVGMAINSVLVRRDGGEIPIEDSSAPIHNRSKQVTGAVLVFHDVSESRIMALKMSHLAQHDFLTGLPNRILLTERITQAIKLAQRHKKLVALLFLDLDNFKHINDSLGHGIGDKLLQSVTTRLQKSVRTSDTVCRQGGDEFVILLSEIDDAQEVAEICAKICTALAAPHFVDQHELHGTASIGISIYPTDGDDVSQLIQKADTAMYHAKTKGRNSYQFFKTEMNTLANTRLLVESQLRRALSSGEFRLHYQPQIDLTSGLMIGAEALIRWHDPELGIRLPEEFLEIAADSGLMLPIGRWVLHEACHQVQAWIDSGLPAVVVAVNISAMEFKHGDFLKVLTQALADSGLAPRYLEIELTESMLMGDTEASTAVLLALNDIGVKLAIDDFGTGYSSLSYLKRFPISTLKIDQSFVRDLATSSDDATIISAVIGMGINLQQRVIAEGVETAAQLAFLQLQKCDVGQGYLFSHPLSSEEFTQLLESA